MLCLIGPLKADLPYTKIIVSLRQEWRRKRKEKGGGDAEGLKVDKGGIKIDKFHNSAVNCSNMPIRKTVSQICGN